MSQSNEQSEIGKMQRGCGAWHGHECARTRYRVFGAGGSRRRHVAPPCHVELPRHITYCARATQARHNQVEASWIGRARSAPARIRCPCVAYWLDGNAHSAAKAPSRRRKTASRDPMLRSNTPKCGEGQLLYRTSATGPDGAARSYNSTRQERTVMQSTETLRD